MQAIDVSGIPFIVFWIDEKESREVVIEFVEDGGGYLGGMRRQLSRSP